MKTPDEIKKGLECCENPNGNPTICEECPYKDTKGSCIDRLYMEARECIRQLEAKDVKQAHRIAELEQELAAVKQERDAAAKDLRCLGECYNCKYRDNQTNCNGNGCCYTCELDCPCAKYPCGYEWRGICPENTEVSPDA